MSAHADYGRSSPADGAVIRDSPALIEAWFTQELFKREGANTLEVAAADGTPVATGPATLDDEDRTHLSVSLEAPLPPGAYTVAWRTLSAVDGDTANGTFTFTIDPAAPPPADASPGTDPDTGGDPGNDPSAPTSSGASGDGGTAFPWWAVIAAAAIAAAGGIGAWGLLAGGPDAAE